jgi:hypothetical protein
MAVMSIIATGQIMMQMAVFGVMHGLVSVCLMGEKMAASYEAKPEWRQRWNLDEQGVIKIQRSVTRAAASLPSLIMWALAPRDGAALALVAVAAVGLFGLLRGRTWGVMALGGAGVAALVTSYIGAGQYFYTTGMMSLDFIELSPHLFGVASGTLLVLAAAPFAAPILSWIARKRLN